MEILGTDLLAPDMGKAADQTGAIGRLILVEAAAVDDPRDDLTHVELHPAVCGQDAI